MNKFLGALVLAASSQAGLAFADDQKTVLFEDTYLERGYTAFGARTANVAGSGKGFASVVGGWHFTDRLVFGLRGDALVSKIDTGVEDSKRLGVTQLGAFGEYEAYTKDIVSLTASLSVGSGDAGYKVVKTQESLLTGSVSETEYRHDSFSFAEPEVSAVLHVSHRVDLALAFGYRKVRGLNLEGIESEGMNGGTAAFMMRGNF